MTLIDVQLATFSFPLAVGPGGAISATGGDAAIRAKVIQVLFTAPGERVNQPDFGCGLFNLVFEPDDGVLAAAVEFTIGQALTRWLRDDLIVDAVDVRADGPLLNVEVAYTRRADFTRQVVRIRFR
ncbi:MAG: GPW/gp25 family protein [Chloroflexales bacterium]|nr:GPW/gp25 family protein [Chloroflexales bacterium]